MARIYSNENFALPVVLQLRALGHDVLTVAESGQANRQMTDEQVLQFATGEGRAVVTLNRRHFVLLHQRFPRHAGIIACTVDADFAGQARRIHEAIERIGQLREQLLRVNRSA